MYHQHVEVKRTRSQIWGILIRKALISWYKETRPTKELHSSSCATLSNADILTRMRHKKADGTPDVWLHGSLSHSRLGRQQFPQRRAYFGDPCIPFRFLSGTKRKYCLWKSNLLCFYLWRFQSIYSSSRPRPSRSMVPHVIAADEVWPRQMVFDGFLMVTTCPDNLTCTSFTL